MPSSKINDITVFLLTLLLFSCGKNNRSSSVTEKENNISKKDYIAFLISTDTLPLVAKINTITSEDRILSRSKDSVAIAMHYFFQAKLNYWDNNFQNASILLDSMKVGHQSGDLYFLKKWASLEQQTRGSNVVDAAVMRKIQELLQKAENASSRITYLFYDLTAKSFYQNKNEKAAAIYVDKYYHAHPYKEHPVVKRRYYDMIFLLASRLDDYEKMAKYNKLAKQLALASNDNLALARTYDNEAQIYARMGFYDESLKMSRAVVSILEKNNDIHDVAYNNLAKSFINIGQLDSAVYYYKKAIAMNKKNMSDKPRYLLYKGLSEAYVLQRDYRKAYETLDMASQLEVKTIKEIEAANIAEIEEKYEAEKKDRNILTLKSKNQHNEDIIRQQKYMLFSGLALAAGLLALIYNVYQQKSLKQKNKLLHSDNSRLKLEHKLLQTQLNPHFVFNSIANLQGLIATGDSTESVRYLSSFSQLLRDILEQSRMDFIDLNEEIISLENYIHLQQMRYPNLFVYRIDIDEQLDTEEVFIPPMLLQPFVENAIEHGFRNIAYKGELIIRVELEKNEIIITIDDNGSGLTHQKTSSQKKKSLAQDILRERLQLLYRLNNQQARFELIEKKAFGKQGICIKINLPIIKNI